MVLLCRPICIRQYLPSQNIAAAYFSPNDDSGGYEIIDVAELQKRTGVNPFPDHSPNFKPQLFELTNTLDDETEQTDNVDGKESGFWAIVAEILMGFWQKLTN